MTYPPFMRALPALDLPYGDEVLTTNALRTEQALVVYFTVHKDLEVPEHSHGAQWGHLFHGSIDLTVGGETRTCVPGDSWNILAGVRHGALLRAGSLLMDVFEEPDRYPFRA